MGQENAGLQFIRAMDGDAKDFRTVIGYLIRGRGFISVISVFYADSWRGERPT